MARNGAFSRRRRLESADGLELSLSDSEEAHVLAVDDSLVDRKVIERLLKISSCKGSSLTEEPFPIRWAVPFFYYLLFFWAIPKMGSWIYVQWRRLIAESELCSFWVLTRRNPRLISMWVEAQISFVHLGELIWVLNFENCAESVNDPMNRAWRWIW